MLLSQTTVEETVCPASPEECRCGPTAQESIGYAVSWARAELGQQVFTEPGITFI